MFFIIQIHHGVRFGGGVTGGGVTGVGFTGTIGTRSGSVPGGKVGQSMPTQTSVALQRLERNLHVKSSDLRPITERRLASSQPKSDELVFRRISLNSVDRTNAVYHAS